MLDTAKSQETLLEVNNVEVIYNHVILVLKGVSLQVPKGGITALLGGNGAGKSTTLKSISNLLLSERGEVTKGSVIYRDQPVYGLSPAELVRRGVIQVMEGRHCFGHLTVEENLLTGAYTRKASRAEIGRALMSKPETVLLDEPSMGLAPQLVEEIFQIVRDLNEKEGVTFLLAEQNTNVALRYAHYGYILESGRVVMDGPAEDLRENPDVKEFYLGVSDEGRKSFRNVRSYRRRKRWLN